jgi:hypothetical protein
LKGEDHQIVHQANMFRGIARLFFRFHCTFR